jgi:2-polyprenyl-3-methyl-5-hydroxy-6-metoxy-1,4-benzoquinol methylase
MTSLAQRSEAEEQMDAADLPPDAYAAVLGDLAQVNALTMAARPTLAFLGRIARPGQSLKVLDVGFGHGDMLRRVARWGDQRGVLCELVGIDLNARSEAVAREATPPHLPITYRTGDYADLAGEGWDAVISSLVAHHMSREQLIAFLKFMDREARLGWLVNDLHRHRLAHMGFPLLARAMGWHRIVREDGTLSVARAFRPGEWHEILGEAGVEGAEVRRWFPFRLCVSRVR